MAAEVGRLAPEFTAKTDEGEDLSLHELRGKRVMLYFFPKAFTGG
jgi:peroxiredoxin Q/BCP